MLTEKSFRIDLVDALRGFAVLAIMLLHNIEHFNMYVFPDPPSEFIAKIDSGIWDTMFFLFGGKAYALFALLFGFSFHIQYTNYANKGGDFRWRYMWRLVLLFCLGCLNAAFFPGEVLVLYAIVGFVLVPVCRLGNKTLLIIAIILMLQPYEWGKFFYAMYNPEYKVSSAWIEYSKAMYPYLQDGNFWAMVKSNLWNGQLFSHLWAWEYGRFFQTASLFMLGMLIGRKGLFANPGEHKTFWQRTLIIAIICFIPLYYLANTIPGIFENRTMRGSITTILQSLRNFSFMTILASLFVFGWQTVSLQKVFRKLCPYGKMSLTNYLTQSMMGSFVYFGYGLGLYNVVSTTASFGIGLLMLTVQFLFCHWWLRNHRYGPFEYIWRKGTWVFSSKP